MGAGKRETLLLTRYKCTHCGVSHTELPDCLIPHKQYASDIITGILDGFIAPDEPSNEGYPCASTISRWKRWYVSNITRIEAYLRIILSKLSDLPDAILTAESSLLRQQRDDDPDWLVDCIRLIYNSGGRLEAVW